MKLATTVHAVTIGAGKKAETIAPGSPVELDDTMFAELIGAGAVRVPTEAEEQLFANQKKARKPAAKTAAKDGDKDSAKAKADAKAADAKAKAEAAKAAEATPGENKAAAENGDGDDDSMLA